MSSDPEEESRITTTDEQAPDTGSVSVSSTEAPEPAVQPGESGARPKVRMALPPELKRQLIEDIEAGGYGLTDDGQVFKATEGELEDEDVETSIHSRLSQLDEGNRLLINGVTVKGEDPGDTRRVIPGKENGRHLMTVHTNVRTRSFDLALEHDAKAYAEALSEISASMGRIIPLEQESPVVVIPNPASPHGYSAIVVLKWAEVSKFVVVDRPTYDEISREDLKARFPHHTEIPFEDQTTGKGEEPESEEP